MSMCMRVCVCIVIAPVPWLRERRGVRERMRGTGSAGAGDDELDDGGKER